MAETSSPEVSKSLKAPEKAQKKVSKKEVKGFYYHAAEYQRKKQQERKGLHRIFRGIIEPFAIHARAWRLWSASEKYGGGGSAVLDTEFVRQALDWGGLFKNKLTEETKQRFKAKSQAHTIFQNAKVNDEDFAKAQGLLIELFNKKGIVTVEDIDRYTKDTHLDRTEIAQLAEIVEKNSSFFQTTEEMRQKLSDEMIYGALDTKQQELATKLFWAANRTTLFSALNIAKIPVVAALAVSPIGWVAGAGIIGSAVMSGVTRYNRLSMEGRTHEISKSRNIDTKQNFGILQRIFSVDWDSDPQHRTFQLIRAAGVGASLGLAFRFVPGISAWAEHGLHNAHGNLPLAQATSGGHEVGLDSTRVNYETYLNNHSVHNVNGLHNINVTHDPNAPTDDHGNHGVWAWGEHDQAIYQNGHLAGIEVNKYGPADGANVMYINANGHNLVLQLPPETGKINLIPSGPGSDGKIMELVDTKVFSDGHVEHVAPFWQETTSANVCQEMGITNRGLENWVTNGNPPGVSTDWDFVHGQVVSGYNFSLANYSLADNGHTINIDILATAQGHGHADIASTFVQKAQVISSLKGDEVENFHSAVAGPVTWVDTKEDWGLEWLRENIFRDNVVKAMDNVTDFGLYNTDNLALWMQEHLPQQVLERPWLLYPALSIPYVASGAAGYFYGKSRAGKKLTVPSAAVNTAATAGLLYVLPGAAVTAGIGYAIGKLTGKKKTSSAKPDNSPSEPSNPSSGGAGSSQSAPSGPAQGGSLPSTGPLIPQDQGAAAPAQAAGSITTEPATPDTVPSTIPGDTGSDEEPVTAPAPVAPLPSTAPETNVEAPVVTDDIDMPAVEATVAASDVLQNTQPFTTLTSSAPEPEKESTFKSELQHMGARHILEALLGPIARQLNIPQEKLDAGINTFLQEAGKLEKVGTLILVADKLHRLAQSPEELKTLLSNVMTVVGQKVAANASREEVLQAIKSVLAEAGEAGAELEALGAEALPVIEEVAPLLV